VLLAQNALQANCKSDCTIKSKTTKIEDTGFWLNRVVLWTTPGALVSLDSRHRRLFVVQSLA